MTELEQVTKLAEGLTVSEQLQLVEHLAHRLRASTVSTRTPVDLYGAWKGKFSEDVDVIAEIREIRDEWKKKFELD